MHYTYLDSPIGKLLIAGDEAGVRLIGFPHNGTARPAAPEWYEAAQALTPVTEQLRAYFAGDLTEFEIPLAPKTTPFQGIVLTALRKVPYGTTVSYGQLARRIGKPGAARAVGMANGRNPIPIIIPCHRVIGADGSLTGFGGGIEAKRWLLALEQRSI